MAQAIKACQRQVLLCEQAFWQTQGNASHNQHGIHNPMRGLQAGLKSVDKQAAHYG